MEEPVKGAMAGPPAPRFRAASGEPAAQSYYRRVRRSAPPSSPFLTLPRPPSQQHLPVKQRCLRPSCP